MGNNQKKLIQVKSLNVGYPGKTILENISFDVYPDDFLLLTGPNGSGKTTLLKTILGLLKPHKGSIIVSNKPDNSEKIKIGYLPQIHNFDLSFPITVDQVIESGLVNSKRINFSLKKEEHKKVDDILNLLGLNLLRNKAIGVLSGGQLQKVFLGRSIISDPALLLLDEPNTYIDNQFQQQFYDLLVELNKSMAIIMVTHDTEKLKNFAKGILDLSQYY